MHATAEQKGAWTTAVFRDVPLTCCCDAAVTPLQTYETRNTVTTLDIPGAQPKVSLAAKELHNWPASHDPRDIDGTKSKTLHPTLNKTSYVCSNADIEGMVRVD